jgi:hypothetical protein
VRRGGGYEFVLPDGADAAPDRIWRQTPKPVPLGDRPQGEGVSYGRDGLTLYASSEKPNAPPRGRHHPDVQYSKEEKRASCQPFQLPNRARKIAAMLVPKTLIEINQMIADAIEESINLDYKAGDSLQNTDGKKKEIAKDVSAMANSAGGVIIYGVKEFEDAERKHMPECLSPVDRSSFSKEQLEQIINSNISPKIEGLRIYPISAGSSKLGLYVVEIPQSTVGHQNLRDQRYYKRYNFESIPMLDYEIRDLMNRSRHPIVELDFAIQRVKQPPSEHDGLFHIAARAAAWGAAGLEFHRVTKTHLWATPRNIGPVLAQYVNFFIHVPKSILHKDELRVHSQIEPDIVVLDGDNLQRDVVSGFVGIPGSKPVYGPYRYVPILPGLEGLSSTFELADIIGLDEREITWTVHCDNAAPKTGSVKLRDIPFAEIDDPDFVEDEE